MQTKELHIFSNRFNPEDKEWNMDFIDEKLKENEEIINRQVECLKNMKEVLPVYSKLGDPNWAAIDAQIEIITGRKTLDNYSNPAIHEYIQHEASRAELWLMGYFKEDLFEELIK